MEVKAEELRIGNLTIWDGSICEVDANQLSSMQYGNITSEPIPLTEQILLKCGFKEHVPNFWSKGAFMITMHEHYFNLSFLTYELEKSVHVLQNLYYGLKGSELEINL